MTEDVIQVTVLNARTVANRLVRIQKLKSLYEEEVAMMRADAVKTTVTALWRRFNEFKKRTKTSPSFVDWLVEHAHLEETFSKANSLPTRRRWAIQYFNFLTRKELTLADDPDNMWMYDALEVAINAKHDEPNWIIAIEGVHRDALPQSGVKEGASFKFGKSDCTTKDTAES
jgi:hypothetical protein